MTTNSKKSPRFTLYTGDCLQVLNKVSDNIADSLVTDPPGGISFLNQGWDSDRGGRDAWIAWLAERLRVCMRVLKPGAHGVVWSLPRTSHWTGTALEDAGFEIVDVISHHFARSFPKHRHALKPTTEFWHLVRKPVSERNVAANVERWGTGRLQIEAVPVGELQRRPGTTLLSHAPDCRPGSCMDGCPVVELDRQSGERPAGRNPSRCNNKSLFNHSKGSYQPSSKEFCDPGGASKYFPRFFYCPKASKKDKGEDNNHPTVKNTALMAWLCKLVTPHGGTVLDPFAGSGSTGIACVREGFGFVGIEQDKSYVTVAQRRLKRAAREEGGLGLAV